MLFTNSSRLAVDNFIISYSKIPVRGNDIEKMSELFKNKLNDFMNVLAYCVEARGIGINKIDTVKYLRTSDRTEAALTSTAALNTFGGRGVRTYDGN